MHLGNKLSCTTTCNLATERRLSYLGGTIPGACNRAHTLFHIFTRLQARPTPPLCTCRGPAHTSSLARLHAAATSARAGRMENDSFLYKSGLSGHSRTTYNTGASAPSYQLQQVCAVTCQPLFVAPTLVPPKLSSAAPAPHPLARRPACKRALLPRGQLAGAACNRTFLVVTAQPPRRTQTK